MPLPLPHLIWLGALLLLCAAGAVVALSTRRIKPKPDIPPQKPEYDISEARRAAESLGSAIRFTTVSHAEVTQWDYAQFLGLRKFLRERYPLCHERLEFDLVGGFSLLFRWASPNPVGDPLLFCGHLDVPPAAGEWDVPPFEGRVSDGYVFGRGALDGKNTVVCLFETVEGLLQRGAVPSRDIYLAFGHDAEVGGGDGAKGFAKLFSHRGIRFALVLDEGAAITDAVIPIGRPVAEIGVSEKGYMNLRLSVRGGSGEISRPPAHTSLGILSEALCRVEFKPRTPRLTPLVKDNLMTIAPWLPYRFRMYLANLWLFRRSLLRHLSKDARTAALVRTTVAPTMSSSGTAPHVLPELSEAVLNVRLLPGDHDRALLSWLEALTEDLDVELEVLRQQPPTRISEYKGQAFRDVSNAIRDVFHDVPVTAALLCDNCDARHYEPFCDHVYRFSPYILNRDELVGRHGENERVAIPSLGAAIAFYRRLIIRLALEEREIPEGTGEEGRKDHEHQSPQGDAGHSAG